MRTVVITRATGFIGTHLRNHFGSDGATNDFRYRYGPAAFIAGWLVTFVAFCAVLTVISMVSERLSGAGGSLGLQFFPLAVMFGVLPALAVGVPLGLITAWPLKRVRNQWTHVAVHAAVTGTVFGLASPLVLGGWNAVTVLVPAAAAAFSAALGRASAIKLVEYKTFILDPSPQPRP